MRSAMTALILCMLVSIAGASWSAAEAGNAYSDIAEHLLEHVKYGEPYAGELASLRSADPSVLSAELQADNSKKAFWINIYNACAQIQIQSNAGQYNDKKAFFTSKNFTVAGRSLSLDDMEHRMLRRAEPSFFVRFLRPFFMSAFMRTLSAERLDPRIHFALNCNARSCPPILFYDAETIDSQLDAAALNYLRTSVAYDAKANVAELPELFTWFSGDFGEQQGIVELLSRYGIIEQGAHPAFTYKPWDWSLAPGRFQ
jgi:hypothetical protein